MASPAYPPGTSASATASASASIVRPAAFALAHPPLAAGPSLPRATLVIGGARSGKSTYAEGMIDDARTPQGARPVYIATAEARDSEMAERIRLHRERRGLSWETIEEPQDLVGVLTAHNGRVTLVDCLTLWLTNVLLADKDIPVERDRLVATVAGLAGPAILIANEVGLGIVPDNALARRFRDEAGLLNQAIAKVCDRVIFMAAGLPMVLKDEAATAATGAAR